MTREEVLDRARLCVCGTREQDYGSPENSFGMIADLWNAYLSGIIEARLSAELYPEDVACMMALLKIARIGGGRGTEDSWVDLAGYAACGGEIGTKHHAEN